MNASPLLTITVPTYNRHENLQFLFHSFLREASTQYSGEVEIIVCDNSDISDAEKNRKLFLNTNIKYIKNDKNIGYCGNVIKCVDEANGCYLWVVSDDDDINPSEFANLVKFLSGLTDIEVGCVILPYVSPDVIGRKRLLNTPSQWGVGPQTTLRKMIDCNDQLPFVLFSGAIISRKHYTNEKITWIKRQFDNNDFIQIPLFIEIITMDAKVVFFSGHIQEYKVSDVVRFDLERMSSSMAEIIKHYLSSNPTLYRRYMVRNCRMWLGWFLWDRSGLIEVNGASAYRSRLLMKTKNCGSIKNIILALLMFSPKIVLRYGYIIYVLICDAIANRRFSLIEMREKFANLGK